MTKYKEMLRSGGVGVVATVVDLVLLIMLTEAAGMSPMEANLPALSGGLVTGASNHPPQCEEGVSLALTATEWWGRFVARLFLEN